MPKAIGIDAGGTLTKVAYFNEQNELVLETFQSSDLLSVKNWITNQPNIQDIGVTGGRTEQLLEVIQAMKSVHYIVEFEATLKGVHFLLDKEGYAFGRSIVTNIGTGTSIHYMEGNTHSRVGGTGIGGGTLIGLSALTTGVTDYHDIREMARNGNRSMIDLLVKDIYQGMNTPIDGQLTASNFGKVGITKSVEHPAEDIIATVQGLVGEVITTLSIQYAEEKNVEHIVYIGSTLSNNEHLATVIANYTRRKNHTPVLVNDHGFSGAIGALLNIVEHTTV
ncbi:type II pantothenate kinase [Lysinibacillus piscis]|uniref:Type II pantothenate kinase n=1 Tax=Lysinibacillus piscis TaxID=2518931 RepID=A0ABQ5NF62_9BACI|nr:type II pantothenate kinase [Lysinibacillus sp. KH24]GLC86915.1 type II pantothenate kinase [Lysinibacillus sp. KH24]